MSRASDHDNFTPLFENVTQDVGLVGAAVYGRVWRYCQGERHVCQAATETIADELHLSRHTVMRHLDVLCQKGYLIDHTPELRNRPHTYSVAERNSTETPTVAESNSPVAESNTDCSTEQHEERSKRESKRDLSPIGENTEDFSDLWGSVPGDSVEPDEPSILSFTDPISMAVEVARRGGGERPMSVPAEAGGADPYRNGPLTATCALLLMTPESLDDKQQAAWARKLRSITESVKGGTPELMTKAIRSWSEHGPTFKAKTGAPYPNPFRKDFEDDITLLMRQLLSETIDERYVVRMT